MTRVLRSGRLTAVSILLIEAKRSYISRSTVSQLLAWLNHLRTDPTQGVILLARHIPRQAAEALIEAKVNFVDDAGNIHLELGDVYNWTAIGLPAPEPISERRPASPAQLQLLFQFVTDPESVNWPVRRLESAAGISKSKAAQARRQMVIEGLLTRAGRGYQLGPISLLADRLILGLCSVTPSQADPGHISSSRKDRRIFSLSPSHGRAAGRAVFTDWRPRR